MLSKAKLQVAAVGFLSAAALLAQDAPLANSSVSINLPADSPVALLNISTGSSRTVARGAALQLDLNLSLTLRNISSNRIHGVTLRVVSQEVAMGGVGSVFQPGLNVGPGEAFPVRINSKLMRPAQMTGGPLLRVDLDGVLFQDLTFYGTDKMHSRRIMTATEQEAQRDRAALKRLLQAGGPQALREGIFKIIQRQNSIPGLQGKVRGPGITNQAVASITPERQQQFAMLQFPDSPVELKQGSVLIAGSQARAPSVDVANRTDRPVRYVEVGWVLTDTMGRSYMAGYLPSSDPAFALPGRGQSTVRQTNTLEFTTQGKPLEISKVTGFVSQVEFADGKVWVPARQNVDSSPLLQQVLSPSVEEERLTNLYSTKGINALVDELNKY